jgi:FMN phosphatase YigB (HAD superfamily)
MQESSRIPALEGGTIMMRPVAIVDVDEILWAFLDAVMATGKDRGVKMPTRHDCTHWDAIFKYGEKTAIIDIFNDVHSHQCSYKPYPEADHFLKFLRTKFHVIIASHRLEKYKPELAEWLKTNNLVYDDLNVSFDKTAMFGNPRVAVVIDDRADTILAALRNNKIGIGLRKPWNCANQSLTLFDSLTDIEKFLENYNEERAPWLGHGSGGTEMLV